ncbi:MAG TPA: NUDIX domain-containing protein, partial [Actinomycetota bacterium]
MSEQIRHAASVVAVREATGGPQILVVERGASSRFLASYVVFPGGAVDAGDTALAGRWFGDEDEAARAAAIRELVEEAGVAVTANGMVSVPDHDPLDTVHAAPPAADQLVDLCHWVAPDDVPVRFDARYYSVRAPVDLEPVPDGAEAAAAWWVSPHTLLERWEHGDAKLYWPTWYTVTRLAQCADAEELFTFRFDAREPTDDE